MIVGSVALGLTILVKLPGVLVLAPIAAVLVARQGLAGAWRPETVARHRRCPCVVAAAWYWHAYQIYRETGLTFGVIGTTKTYPAFVATSEWTTAFSKWSSVELLTSAPLYDLMLSRLYFLHLTPPGFALALVGLVVWRAQQWRAGRGCVAGGDGGLHPGRRARATWATTTTSSRWCRSSRCTLPPPRGRCSMLAGLRRRSGPGLAPRVGMALVVAAVAAMSFWHSGVIARHFRPAAPDVRILRAGEAIRARRRSSLG